MISLIALESIFNDTLSEASIAFWTFAWGFNTATKNTVLDIRANGDEHSIQLSGMIDSFDRSEFNYCRKN